MNHDNNKRHELPENPYLTPTAELGGNEENNITEDGILETPRRETIGAGWRWIKEAFDYFAKSPGMWILTIVVFFAIYFASGLIGQVYPWVNYLANFIYAIWLGGIMLGCQIQFNKKTFHIKYLFSGFSKNTLGLFLVSLITMVISTITIILFIGLDNSMLLFGFKDPEPSQVIELMSDKLFWIRFLSALLILLPLMAAFWFAPTLVMLHNLSPVNAMWLSLKGCLINFIPFLWYSVLITILFVLAALPLLLGWFVLFPVFYASVYTSYRGIFLEQKNNH